MTVYFFPSKRLKPVCLAWPSQKKPRTYAFSLCADYKSATPAKSGSSKLSLRRTEGRAKGSSSSSLCPRPPGPEPPPGNAHRPLQTGAAALKAPAFSAAPAFKQTGSEGVRLPVVELSETEIPAWRPSGWRGTLGVSPPGGRRSSSAVWSGTEKGLDLLGLEPLSIRAKLEEPEKPRVLCVVCSIGSVHSRPLGTPGM